MQRAVHYLSPHETRSFRAEGAGLAEGEALPGSQLVAVVDFPDEAYVLATLPIMRGSDAALLRRRRLEREFPGATLTALEVLRRRSSDGVTDAVMMAVNGGQSLQDALAERAAAHALSAVTTPALLVAEWLRRARLVKRRVLVVMPTPAGVRLVFIDNARATLSRLTGPLAPASTSTEIARTVQYLQNTQRVERGENIELWFWGVDDATAAACVPTGTAVTPSAAPRVAALPDPERDGLDALLALALQSPGKLQLAPDELRLGWLARGVERSGRLAAAAVLLLSVGIAGVLEWRATRLTAEVTDLVAQRALIESDAAQLNESLQRRGLSLADVATLPEAERALARGALQFDAVLSMVGSGFASHPDVLLQRVEMRAAASDALASDAVAVPATDAGSAAAESSGAASTEFAVADAVGSEACASGPPGELAVVDVEFGLAPGLDVRRRDAALGAVRAASAALQPWRTSAAALAIGRRDALIATDDVDGASDAARWNICLRRRGDS
jgi:hypothetical protein